jgi:trk system potassium uptake protein TrkA
VDEIRLPPGATLGAVVRGEQVIMAHHDTRIEPGDHVIVFVASKRLVPQVEELFQVSASFL